MSFKFDNSETKFPERNKHSLILKYFSFKSFFNISSDSNIFVFPWALLPYKIFVFSSDSFLQSFEIHPN